MNTVLNLLRRQTGHGFAEQYDATLLRLLVRERDSWKGISPSRLSADYNPSPPILAAKFAKCSGLQNVLAIANEDGKIAIQDTNRWNKEPGGERSLDGVQCHYNAVFDVEWMPGEMKIVTASGDHTAQLLSLTNAELVRTQVFRGHSRSVKTVAFQCDDPAVFATGGRDGAIIAWDIRAKLGSNMLPRADNCIYNGHSGGPGTPASYRRRTRQTPKIPAQGCSSSITGLAFQNANTLISCGAGDGVVKVWDTRRHYTSHQRDPLPKYSFSYSGTTTLKGFTNLVIDHSRHRLYVNCMDNYIYCYNVLTYDGHPLTRYSGYKNGTFYVKSALSPDGQYLISGSSDEHSYIWNIDNSRPLLKLHGHAAEVTSVAWMHDWSKVRIVTCSDDACHKVWRLGPEELDPNEKMQLRGTAEYCNSYSSEQFRIKSLEFTPRSVKRFVQRNETTPSAVKSIHRTTGTMEGQEHASVNSMARDGDLKNDSIGNSTTKRSLGVMSQNNGVEETSLFPPVKRAFREECRGRRLFSPLSSQPAFSFNALEVASRSSSSHSLSAILEASEEDTVGGITSCKSPLATADLNVRPVDSDQNATAITSALSSNNIHPLIYSPTLNLRLPNFVMDGEAPHLVNVIASGGSLGSSITCGVGAASSGGTSGQKKYKLKENIDWLTKFRKQKLLQAAKSIANAERRPLLEDAPVLSPTEDTTSLLLSPQLKRLKTGDDKKNSVNDSIPNVNVDHTSSPVLMESAACSNSSLPTTPLRRTVSRWSSGCVEQADVQGNCIEGERTPRRRHNLITPYSPAGVIGLQQSSSGYSSIRRFFAATTPNNCPNVLTTL